MASWRSSHKWYFNARWRMSTWMFWFVWVSYTEEEKYNTKQKTKDKQTTAVGNSKNINNINKKISVDVMFDEDASPFVLEFNSYAYMVWIVID